MCCSMYSLVMRLHSCGFPRCYCRHPEMVIDQYMYLPRCRMPTQTASYVSFSISKDKGTQSTYNHCLLYLQLMTVVIWPVITYIIHWLAGLLYLLSQLVALVSQCLIFYACVHAHIKSFDCYSHCCVISVTKTADGQTDRQMAFSFM